MELTPEQVDHIAGLARLELSEDEREGFRRKLSSVLAYVDTLSEVDVEGVEPMSHSVRVHNVLREDEPAGCDVSTRDALIEAFPEKEDDLLKVKAVFS